jgi:uncharacterized protein YjiS (DUF1127 family)
MAALTDRAIVQTQHRRMFALTAQMDCEPDQSKSACKKDEAKQMAYVNTIRAAEGGIVDRLTLVVKSVKAAFERRRLYSQTLYELNGLNDRELADLGIHRSMIRDIAREAAYGN